jgi:cupin 2 domain-containing protein
LDNLFHDLPLGLDEEFVTSLLDRPGARIERIVSTGQATPAGEWLEQPWDEWVLLLAGSAGLLIEGQEELRLAAGDHLLIASGIRHRVTWTTPDRPTLWLAIHFGRD